MCRRTSRLCGGSGDRGWWGQTRPARRISAEGDALTEEFAISQSAATRSVHAHYVLAVVPDLHDAACFVPAERVVPALVLYLDVVVDLERGKWACAVVVGFGSSQVALS